MISIRLKLYKVMTTKNKSVMPLIMALLFFSFVSCGGGDETNEEDGPSTNSGLANMKLDSPSEVTIPFYGITETVSNPEIIRVQFAGEVSVSDDWIKLVDYSKIEGGHYDGYDGKRLAIVTDANLSAEKRDGYVIINNRGASGFNYNPKEIRVHVIQEENLLCGKWKGENIIDGQTVIHDIEFKSDGTGTFSSYDKLKGNNSSPKPFIYNFPSNEESWLLTLEWENSEDSGSLRYRYKVNKEELKLEEQVKVDNMEIGFVYMPEIVLKRN